jgi:hypothetical protein
MSLQTPVAFFIYNRPLHTARVFARIAEARPEKMFIIADGPMDDFDRAGCDDARAAVSDVTWNCDVFRQYSDSHLGCRHRTSGGLDWVFAHAERAIILEDDCLPDATFFPYCDELLERYEDEERVMTVSGDNFQFGVSRTRHSYYFSAIHHLWGWATWRRAWAHHDAAMTKWPGVANTEFPGDLIPPYAAAYHKRMMAETYAGRLDRWNYQWILACWLQRAMCALPAVNLVSNIGFGPQATNCKRADARSALSTRSLAFPLQHPPISELSGHVDEPYRLPTSKAA